MLTHQLIPQEEDVYTIERREAEQAWIKRKAEIAAEQSTAVGTAWYTMAWTYCVGMCSSIQQAFQSSDLVNTLYPDNPGTQDIFTHAASSILPTVLKVASPIALAFSWLNAIHAVRTFIKTENKNILAYSNVFFSCAAPVIWTALFIAGFAASAVALAPILPWVSVAVFGAYALHGIFHCAINCYRAWQAHQSGDKKVRNEYLKQAAKNIVGIVFNVIALTASVFLGIKMSEATGKIGDAVEYFKQTWKLDKLNDAMASITNLFDKGCKTVAALTVVAAVGVVAQHAKRIVSGIKSFFNWVRGKSSASAEKPAAETNTNSTVVIKTELEKPAAYQALSATDRTEPAAGIVSRIRTYVRNGTSSLTCHSMFKPKGKTQPIAARAEHQCSSVSSFSHR